VRRHAVEVSLWHGKSVRSSDAGSCPWLVGVGEITDCPAAEIDRAGANPARFGTVAPTQTNFQGRCYSR